MSTSLFNPPSHADEAWKDALDVYFPEFMSFFYADIADKIDWQAGYEMMDKELQALTTESMVGKRLVDKLIKVRFKAGQECFVLLHTEIQGDYEANFPQRLFEYFYRLYDRYRLPILTLVVLADDSPTWRPQHYQLEVGGYRTLTFQFLINKLLDYQGQEAALLEKTNPFGIMVAAHLAALETRPDPEARYEHKFALTRCLYEQGLGRDTIMRLFYFIDGILTLPEELGIRYKDSIYQLEKEHTVAYISSIERIGMKKGELAFLSTLLQEQFPNIPLEQYKEKLDQADAETLLNWGKRVLKAKTLTDVFQNH
jgi:hypothetical protein